MGFWSWLTGHDKTESDLYANYDKVEVVESELNRIATSDVAAAQEEINNAINELNNVPGMAEYVGSINVAAYSSVFESLTETIQGFSTQLNQKAESIKEYEESSIFEKIGSTAAMGLFKVGEGLLSVAEDLGDGIVSLIGWGAGALGATGLQEDCANFIKKEWSHDAFNFYYNSDFAKASAITEDSAIAGGLKIAGKAVGYLYAGGVLAGSAGISNATNLGIGIFKASGTTMAATAVAGVGGLGVGTENGLNSGLEYNSAMGVGLKQGLTSAALAFAGGKISETMSAYKDGATGLKDALSKSSNYQGYTDAVTKAGIRFGEAQRGVVTNGVEVLRAQSALKKSPQDASLQQRLGDAKTNLQSSIDTIKVENPLSQGLNATKNAITSIPSGLQSVGNSIRSNGILKTAGDGVKAIAGTAAKIVKSPVTPGVVAVTANSAILESATQTGIQKKEYAEALAAMESQLPSGESVEDIFIQAVDPSVPAGDTSKNLITDGNSNNTGEEPITGSNSNTGNYNISDGNNNYSNNNDNSDNNNNNNNNNSSGDESNNNNNNNGDENNNNNNNNNSDENNGNNNNNNSDENNNNNNNNNNNGDNGNNNNNNNGDNGNNNNNNNGDNGNNNNNNNNNGNNTGDNGNNDNSSSEDTGSHSGGEYDEEGFHPDELEAADELEDLLDIEDEEIDEETEESVIEDVIKGNSYTKIPTSQSPITSNKKKTNSVLPIAAGLTVAAAAGIGAKAYMDYKKNSEFEDEEYDDEEYSGDDEFQTDEWQGDNDTLDLGYSDEEGSDYLSDESDYSYQAVSSDGYSAKSNNDDELVEY